MNAFIEDIKAKQESDQLLTEVMLPSDWSPSKEWKEIYLSYNSKAKDSNDYVKPDISTREGQITISTRLSRIKEYHKEQGNIKPARDGQNIMLAVTDKGLHQIT